MKKYVKIISNDVKFSRMLSIELSERGIETVNEAKAIADEEKLFIVADLDECSPEDLNTAPEKATVIGYTREDPSEISEKCKKCSSVLCRPFYISDFLEVFGEQAVIESKRSSPSKKRHFLTVDQASKVALWGDMRIPLSDNECKVLAALCESRGKLVEREKIYALLGAEDGNMGDVYICHLRRKIDNKLGLKLIYTVRGKGYILKN